MTVEETLLYIQTLLDDRAFEFFSFRNAVEAVRQAQMMVIQEAINKNEERCLRPLYAIHPTIDDVILQSDQGERLLPENYHHARSLEIFLYIENKPMPMGTARYIRPGEFLSLANRQMTGLNPITGSRFASSRVISNYSWTIQGGKYFWSMPTGQERAMLTYIRKPVPFGSIYTMVTLVGTEQKRYGLEVPQEYHVKVASMAAELLNDLDTLEQEREQLQTEAKIIEGQQ